MAIVKPFRGFRPLKDKAKLIASRPYDVLSSEEARESAKNNPLSFLHIIKPEIDLPEDIDVHSATVYEKGKQNLLKLINNGIYSQDKHACYYVYAQTLNNKTQYGLVGCAHIDDYLNEIIKKHELTRPDKEDDRVNHINTTNFNAEPVFFAYPDNKKINEIVAKIIRKEPEYDFVAEDEIGHHLWTIDDQNLVEKIETIFREEVPYTYVADGHHRTAAAARVGIERRKNNPNHTGDEEYNYFMAVHFPASQLNIIDYNRVIKDLNGLSIEEFISKLGESFTIQPIGPTTYKPQKLHEFSMYLEGNWFRLEAKYGTYNDCDPVEVLDVTILTCKILRPILDIQDLRRSTRIDFVGGIRGLNELKRRVDSGEMKAAFALYPVSMEQLFKIADNGSIMPPKTTWFEPKLRSGLVLHSLS